MHSDSTIFCINAASCILSAHVYVELDFFAFLLGCFSAAVHFDLKVTSLPDKMSAEMFSKTIAAGSSV